MEEKVILVDENDKKVGLQEKMEAHRQGNLHRAFSVFVFDKKGKMLLQQRSFSKYHSGGLWTNACCSHPREDESVESAAHRRLMEEMGFDTDLNEVLSFIYFAELDKGLKEHEYDHVLFGFYGGDIRPDPNEVASYKWVGIDWLTEDMKKNPKNYTAWFIIIINRVLEKYKNGFSNRN